MDPIANTLVRIQSAQKSRKDEVELPHSKVIASILTILKNGGYIAGFEEKGVEVKRYYVKLRYTEGGLPVIRELRRVSKPSLRVYKGWDELPRIQNGLGTVIVSTNKGIMTGRQAAEGRHGGEVLCTVL